MLLTSERALGTPRQADTTPVDLQIPLSTLPDGPSETKLFANSNGREHGQIARGCVPPLLLASRAFRYPRDQRRTSKIPINPYLLERACATGESIMKALDAVRRVLARKK
jgi:hypothetical protein